ncbi:MAG: SusC/RagA family TonB-linked outer membrane protein, partial [Muribaculaceae bacterium]|nr:SusC/RagA family TonB-linked outer membrane protein [Muribaculaceae bacterium]
MKKQFALLGALLLACGMSYSYAEPAPQAAVANAASLRGTVVDQNGEPVIGATISEMGTTRATATDVDGKFAIRSASGARLQVSSIGYKTQVLKASDGMRVVLAEDNALLDEVVVVGYGQQKKVNLTGAVSVVDVDKTLTSRPEQDVARALQGAVPGLSIVSNSGNLGDNPTITIRGVGTLSNGATSNPLIVVDGVPVDDLSMINGADIASVSVLKDAASSSIYGTRAAFGVILITTKQGKKGDRVSVRYDNNFAWDRATYLPDYPDVPSQLQAAIRAKARQGAGAVELFGMYFDDLLPYAIKWKEQNSGRLGYGEMRPYVDENNVGDYRFIGGQPMYYADFDIQKIWYQSAAPSQTHNVSVDGSSGRTTFRAAFGYSGKEDLFTWNTGKRQRYNASVNFATDVTDWLTVGARMNFNRKNFNRAETYNNMYQYLWRWGSFFIPSGTINGEDFRVVAMQKQADRRRITNDELRITAFLKANITKFLTLNGDFTYQVNNANMSWSDFPIYGMNWMGTTPTYIVSNASSGTDRENLKANTWTGNLYLEFNKSVKDAHNFKVMVGMTGEKRKYDYFRAYRSALYSTDYPELNLTYGPQTQWAIESATSGNTRLLPFMRGDYATAGYFARFNYDYKGIYLFEANGRYDGSSAFPSSDRWAFFPSFSLGYRFSEESYWDKARDVVSNGKIRFSYGTIGNEAVGDNMFVSTIGSGTMSYLNGSNAAYLYFGMPSWVSSSLSWEKIKTTNVGIDLGFLNDQITLSAEWFQRTTNNMLAPGAALPPSVGASAPYMNNGTLRSRGWELTINWRKQFNKDLGLYANFS